MSQIAKRTEETIDYNKALRNKMATASNVTDAISYATCRTAMDLNTKAILSPTNSGHTARMVSKFRPNCPIVATTSDDRVMRQLSLTWGVLPIKNEKATTTDQVISNAIEAAKDANYVNSEDLVVVTAGVTNGVSGTTNLIKVETV